MVLANLNLTVPAVAAVSPTLMAHFATVTVPVPVTVVTYFANVPETREPVTRIVPGVGNVAMFLQTPYGLLAAAGVPLLIYLLYDLLRRRQLEKTEKAKSLQLQEELDRMKQQLAEGNAQETPEANKNDGDPPA